MALEPVTALTLATSVVQFITFASKLISKGYKFYESADGALIEHSEHAAVAANLVDLTHGLDHSLAAFATGKLDFKAWAREKTNDLLTPRDTSSKEMAQRTRTLARLTADERKVQKTLASSEEKALHQVTADCRRAAEEFLEALEKLKVKGGHKGWQSFRQAFKSIWGKDKIEAMLKGLSAHREQLMIHLLVVMNNQQLQSLAVMTNSNAHMEQNILNAILRQDSRIESKRVEKSILGLVHEVQRGFRDMRLEQAERRHGLRETSGEKSQRLHKEWQAEIQGNIYQILERLDATLETQKYDSIKQKMLDSLYFTQIEERQSKIPEAHANTFKWVFEKRHRTQTSWTNFADWCCGSDANDNLYWVAGKAGSGKSTLMRYLYNHRETRACLQDWASPKVLVTAKCFFWNPGTEIQKSWVGLLRSLLYDLLHQCPELIPSAAPARWRSYEFGTRQFDTWTEFELLDAFHAFVREAGPTTSICLFIDGLDEFEGSDDQHLELTEFFQNISHFQHVKVCASSRPWLIFQDQFAKTPQLLLEDLTSNDIRDYVQDTLEQHNRFQALRLGNSVGCIQLVLEIVERARGVFLWVYLVIRSLQHGLRNEDSILDLTRRLRTIPSNLEPYLGQMMMTIDPFYRHQATALFRLALSAQRPLSLMTVSFLHEYQENSELALSTPLMPVSNEIVLSRLLSMKRRLNSRCKGLVEVYSTRREGLFLKQTVDFMHRTVRDFLLTKEAQRILNSYSTEAIDAPLFTLNALIAQVKMLDINNIKSIDSNNSDDFIELLDEILCCADDIESSKGELPLSLMSDLDLACMTHHQNRRVPLSRYSSKSVRLIGEWWESPQDWACSLLTLTIQTGRTSYAKTAIQSDRRLITEKIGRPLLDCALRRQLRSRSGLTPDIDLVQLILSQGGNPNQIFEGTSVWVKFLVHMVDKRDEKHEWLEATELLIEHGASRKFPFRRKYRDGTRDERSSNMALFHTPYDLLTRAFGETQAAELDWMARHSRKPRWHSKTGVAEKATARKANEAEKGAAQTRSLLSIFCCLYR